MPENGANGANGNNGRDGRDRNIPVPDPTTLTTIALDKEIDHISKLLSARMDQMDQRANDRYHEQQQAVDQARDTANKAIEAALEAADKATKELDASITRRLVGVNELTDSKFEGIGKEFVTYRTLLDSASEKTQAALAAADKAITKAEGYNEKRFEQQADLSASFADQAKSFVTRQEFDTLRLTTTEKIDDLKAYQANTLGRTEATPSVAAQIQALMDKVEALRTYQSTTQGVASTSTVDVQLAAMKAQIETNTALLATGAGKSQGFNMSWGYLLGGLSLVVIVVNVIIALIAI